MAKDGYVSVRLTKEVYDALAELKDDLVQHGTGNLPRTLRRTGSVLTLSGVVEIAVKATRCHLKDHAGEK